MYDMKQKKPNANVSNAVMNSMPTSAFQSRSTASFPQLDRSPSISAMLSLSSSAPPASGVQFSAEQQPERSSGDILQTAAVGVRGFGRSLPYLSQLQTAFGESGLSKVQAYQGSGAQQACDALNANAYAIGNKVAFADPNPDLHTVAHETTHVLQQERGVHLKSNVGEVGDRYEQQADAVADRVVQGQSVQAALGTINQPQPTDGTAAFGSSSAGQVVQMMPPKRTRSNQKKEEENEERGGDSNPKKFRSEKQQTNREEQSQRNLTGGSLMEEPEKSQRSDSSRSRPDLKAEVDEPQQPLIEGNIGENNPALPSQSTQNPMLLSQDEYQYIFTLVVPAHLVGHITSYYPYSVGNTLFGFFATTNPEASNNQVYDGNYEIFFPWDNNVLNKSFNVQSTTAVNFQKNEYNRPTDEKSGNTAYLATVPVPLEQGENSADKNPAQLYDLYSNAVPSMKSHFKLLIGLNSKFDVNSKESYSEVQEKLHTEVNNINNGSGKYSNTKGEDNLEMVATSFTHYPVITGQGTEETFDVDFMWRLVKSTRNGHLNTKLSAFPFIQARNGLIFKDPGKNIYNYLANKYKKVYYHFGDADVISFYNEDKSIFEKFDTMQKGKNLVRGGGIYTFDEEDVKSWVRRESQLQQPVESRYKKSGGVPQIQGLQYEQILGDGNCLFNAVALYCSLDYQQLRTQAADHMKSNENFFGPFVTALTSGKQTLDEYTEIVRNTTTWGDALEIIALMYVLQRPIIVIDSSGSIRNLSDFESFSSLGEPIFVYYNGHNHYDALVLQQGYTGQDILNRLLGRTDTTTTQPQGMEEEGGVRRDIGMEEGLDENQGEKRKEEQKDEDPLVPLVTKLVLAANQLDMDTRAIWDQTFPTKITSLGWYSEANTFFDAKHLNQYKKRYIQIVQHNDNDLQKKKAGETDYKRQLRGRRAPVPDIGLLLYYFLQDTRQYLAGETSTMSTDLSVVTSARHDIPGLEKIKRILIGNDDVTIKTNSLARIPLARSVGNIIKPNNNQVRIGAIQQMFNASGITGKDILSGDYDDDRIWTVLVSILLNNKTRWPSLNILLDEDEALTAPEDDIIEINEKQFTKIGNQILLTLDIIETRCQKYIEAVKRLFEKYQSSSKNTSTQVNIQQEMEDKGNE